MRGELGPEAQGGQLALRHRRSADHLFYILSMVAWLSDGLRELEAKQSITIGLLRDNRSNSYDS
jgi:TorA maturation chaperone TorD